ncbi:MAG: hypothetical protein GF355_16325, partial [Candidatus Eisenbacteria bacterium]|nr:hypothetical protein [Candidatus Eisenbacteria bacterium]
MLRRLILAILLLGVASGPLPAQPDTYVQVRLHLTDPEVALAELGSLDVDVMAVEEDAVTLALREPVLEELDARGYRYEVEIPDLQAYYAGRLGRDQLDNFGVFHTYSEAVAEMNAIHNEFPQLTTAPMSLGTSWQGNELWAMKISDNPGVEEEEPEVLFDGLHHAREVMTVEVLLHFMRHLCENYGDDPLVTALVDNRQIWFVPIVNPDGYLYNELIAPNGGGMWRKNRRDNGGCWGVDLNRNYPYMWGGTGSSGDPCEDTYRGPDPASEPETQALIDFIIDHEFITHQSYHSVAGMVLYPWGYTNNPAPDEDILDAIAQEMASQNGYAVGQPGELLYLVSGGAFDWSYGEQNDKNKIFCFTTEIGGSGFWPDPSEREPLIQENLYSNIYLVQTAGAWVRLDGLTVSGGNGDGQLDPGETVDLVPTVENVGILAGADNVRAVLASSDPYIQLTDAVSEFGHLDPGESQEGSGDPFSLTVDPAVPGGHSVDLAVHITGDPGVDYATVVTKIVTGAALLYATDFETDSGGWSQDPIHNASTGAFVRIDPNPTSYQPGDDTTPAPGIHAWVTAQNSSLGEDDVDGGVSATRSPVLDLSGVVEARLQLNYFFGQRDWGDDSGDYFRLQLSNDGGASYPADLVSFGDETHAAIWTPLALNLEDELALTGQMRLRVMAADGSSTGDIVEAGVDDIVIVEDNGNDPPAAPLLAFPADGAENQPPQPLLGVENAADPEGDALTYGFRVYSDSLLTDVAAMVDGIAEGNGTTSWQVSPALVPGEY